MATETVVGSYVYTGCNPSLEIQNLKLEYTWSIVNNTTGKISAKLYVKRDEYGPTYNVNGTYSISATVPSGKITIASGSHYPTYSTPIDTTYRLVGEGEKTFTLKNNGTSATEIALEASYTINDNRKLKGLVLPASKYANGTASQTGELNFIIPIQTTPCGAPSTVSLSGDTNGIITPNGQVTVTWEEGSAGSGNEIKGYMVYWRGDSSAAPTTSSYTGKSDLISNSTSYVIDLSKTSGLVRGRALKVGVITVGSVSGYDSLMTISNIALTINSLPSAPSLSIADNIYRPSDTVEITNITITDQDSSTQSLSLKYNTSPDVSSAEIITNGKFTLPSTNKDATTADYYFWSYDGLETSSTYTEVTLKISTAINFSSASLTGTKLITTPANSDYCIAPTLTLTNNLTKGKYFCEILTSTTKTGTYVESGYSFELSGDKKTYNIADIRILLKEKNSSILNGGGYYKIRVTYTSDLNETKTNNTAALYISAKPNCTLYNFTNAENKSNVASYFYNKLSVAFPKDTGYSNAELIIVSSNGNESYKFEANLEEKTISGTTYYVANYNPSTQFSENLLYSFSVNLKKGNYSCEKDKIGELTQIRKIKQNELSIVPIATQNTADGLGTESNPYHLFTGQQITFGLSGSGFSLQNMVSYGLVDKKVNCDSKSFSLSFNSSSSRHEFTISGTNLYDLLYKLKTGLVFGAPMNFIITNEFGLSVSIKITFYCTLKEETLKQLSEVKFYTDLNGTKTEISQVQYLKESMPIYFSCNSFSLYGNKCTINFYYLDNNNQKILYDQKQITATSQSFKYNTSLQYSAISLLALKSLPEMIESFTGRFVVDLQVSTPINSSNKEGVYFVDTNVSNSFNIKRHTSPSFSFRGVELLINNNDKKTYKFLFNKNQDLGLDYTSSNGTFLTNNSLTVKIKYIYDKTTTCEQTLSNFALKDFYVNEYLIIDPSTAVSNLPENWNSVDIQVDLIVTHTVNNYSTTKTQSVAQLLLFNLLPTVSYRKNFLGINTQTFPQVKDGMIYISEYENYKKIYLISVSGTIREIDLSTGLLEGFKIDGGSW